MDYYQPLHSKNYYHIYNRGNNGDNLFYKGENYNYFLRKYDYYLSDYLNTFAYCLLPNHFHLLVNVKDFEGQKIGLQKGIKTLTAPEEVISEQFRRLFLSYAKAINEQEPRTGSLFQKNFKRKKVNNEKYFNQLVYYIHANPQNHGICIDFRDYPHSSYERILSDKPSKLFKQEVLNWFGDKDTYLKFHAAKQDIQLINSWMIEEA
jgi:REP element-mobilizing transposase RayT